MSEFLKFAYEVLSKIVYNIAGLADSFVKLFITGWKDYFNIFFTYLSTLEPVGKILSVLLMLLLIAVPVTAILLIVRGIVLKHRIKRDALDNPELLKEIGRLNRQVLELMEEKNKILAIKVNAMGGTQHIPYMGAAALADDTIPSVGNITGANGTINLKAEATVSDETIDRVASAVDRERADDPAGEKAKRFPKLELVDIKYRDAEAPEYDHEITLEDFVGQFRLYAAGQFHLYYAPEIIRRFVAGMAASKLLILEGISGTGKTSLPYSFSRYLGNPATLVSVQPSYRDRTELLGYFNEFSKKFNETEFLRALYEANYREDPSLIVLDEMNLARIEYYFAEMLSVLEMPNTDEWTIDLVPTGWKSDPVLITDGKLHVSEHTWFIGTANNDDSTFTITDKVYDRAIPIELNERAEVFESPDPKPCYVTCEYLQSLFEKAKSQYPISEDSIQKLSKLDEYLKTRFKLAFGNRIMKQMYDFVPVYVACGGSELGGMDYIIARKVFKKFESLNVSFVRDEIKGLNEYMEKLFGSREMTDSREYLTRIQNLY